MEKIYKTIQDILQNYTAYELSKKTGVTKTALQFYKNGDRKIENMTLKTAEKILNFNKKL